CLETIRAWFLSLWDPSVVKPSGTHYDQVRANFQNEREDNNGVQLHFSGAETAFTQGENLARLLPGSGTLFDVDTILDSNASATDKALAATSLASSGIPLLGKLDEAEDATRVIKKAENTAQGLLEIRKIVNNKIRRKLPDIQKLDRNAIVGYRGSLSRGTKHPSKGNAPFNPNDYDVDAFIVSDVLAEKFSPAEWFRNGSNLHDIKVIEDEIIGELNSELLKKPRSFNFRIYNFNEYTRKVQKDAYTIIK
ncbi:MAG: hypothetical protein J6X44_00300, partial [Thermoguttaceae bacterium]|nr:hypothetical protein [Thermoguttaceae bacterium]